MAFKYKITRRLASEHKVMPLVSAVMCLIGCMEDHTGATRFGQAGVGEDGVEIRACRGQQAPTARVC